VRRKRWKSELSPGACPFRHRKSGWFATKCAKDADQALAILRFMPKKGARFLSKLIESAVANAENNHELNRNDLFVSQIFAGEGPQMKRMKAGSRGRYKPRIKRSAHVTVILAEHELEG
jgi:large subunit ribosomal protein L22